MKTLYMSDLDGTLLRSDATLSEYTCQTINDLVGNGLLFSYATARSFITASKVTADIRARIPMAAYNGAFIKDSLTGELLLGNFFAPEIHETIDDLLSHNIYPIVYSLMNGEEKMSFLPEKCSRGMAAFLHTRRGDPRIRLAENESALHDGEIFYITCIDEAEKLLPLYEKYREKQRCLYQQDVYSHEQWLEILPPMASKANAVGQLKEKLGCQRVVVFGDGKNDMDMFSMADEAYAVANAVDELKQMATGVIRSNDEDGVARWLMENAQTGEKET